MATLSDEFMNDLDDFSDGGDDEIEETRSGNALSSSATASSSSSSAAAASKNHSQTSDGMKGDNNNGEKTPGDNASSGLDESEVFVKHCDEVRNVLNGRRAGEGSQNGLDSHALLVRSNNYVPQILSTISKVHNDAIDLYSQRFPGMEEVIKDPIKYCRIARIVGCIIGQGQSGGGGGDDDNVAIPTLSDRVMDEKVNIVNAIKNYGINEANDGSEGAKQGGGTNFNDTQFITLSVSCSMNPGRNLSKSDEVKFNEKHDKVMKLHGYLMDIRKFVEIHVVDVCPNVVNLVGVEVAAGLISYAGGLKSLTRIPSCNILLIGMSDSTKSSAVVNSLPNHKRGLVQSCILVRDAPQNLKQRVAKVLCNKLILCARMDMVRKGKDEGSQGLLYRDEIVKNIEKWDNVDYGSVKKALPKPIMESSKKRGGRKVRKAKERFKLSSVHELQNKRTFGEVNGEYADDAMGNDLGMLGESRGKGKVRFDNVAVKKAKLSQSKMAIKKRGRRGFVAASAPGGSNAANSSGKGGGFSTSVVFNNYQGLELAANDGGEDKEKDKVKKWFKDDSGFKSALK